jgi:hypothetical protein
MPAGGSGMAIFAHLMTDLRCPSCNTVVSDVVWFQWGFCRGYDMWPESLYHLGDTIRWQHCDNGSILSWVLFYDGERQWGGNVGDPAIKNLMVRDWYQFYWEDPAQRRRCETCQGVLEGAMVEIRDGVVKRAWIYQPGEFDNETQEYIIQADGTLKPMPEWKDHPMGLVRPGC